VATAVGVARLSDRENTPRSTDWIVGELEGFLAATSEVHGAVVVGIVRAGLLYFVAAGKTTNFGDIDVSVCSRSGEVVLDSPGWVGMAFVPGEGFISTGSITRALGPNPVRTLRTA
jgi:hypothetical protein